jgi:hypothetical protein
VFLRYEFGVVIVYSMRNCVLFNVLFVYCLLFIYLAVYFTYIVLTLSPVGQLICSSVIIRVIIILISLIRNSNLSVTALWVCAFCNYNGTDVKKGYDMGVKGA